MTNIKLTFTICILLFSAATSAQDNLGSLGEGLDIRLSAGMNMFGPLNVSRANSFGKIDIIYEKSIVKETKKTPTIGLSLLGTITPINKRLNDAAFIRYNVMQTGLLGFVPSIYLKSKPIPDLQLFINLSAGIQYYPLIQTETDDWGKLDGFDQRLVAFGGGFKYGNLIRSSIQYYRRWHDFSTRTEEYYKTNVNQATFFSNFHYNFSVGNTSKIYLFLNWYGRPAKEPKTKFYNAGVSLNIFNVCNCLPKITCQNKPAGKS